MGGRLQVQGGAASDGVAYEGATVLEAKQVRDPGLLPVCEDSASCVC